MAKRREWTVPTVPEYYIVDAPLEEAQKEAYKTMNDQFVLVLESGVAVTAMQVITQMMKLQQISSGFVYLENGRYEELVPPNKTSKMSRLLEILAEEIPGKVVIAYHFARTGEALLECLKKYNPAVICSSERMKGMGRDAVSEKRKFNNGEDGCRVMLLQMASGKYGHDLSGVDGDRTQYMIFYENTFFSGRPGADRGEDLHWRRPRLDAGVLRFRQFKGGVRPSEGAPTKNECSRISARGL